MIVMGTWPGCFVYAFVDKEGSFTSCDSSLHGDNTSRTSYTYSLNTFAHVSVSEPGARGSPQRSCCVPSRKREKTCPEHGQVDDERVLFQPPRRQMLGGAQTKFVIWQNSLRLMATLSPQMNGIVLLVETETTNDVPESAGSPLKHR